MRGSSPFDSYMNEFCGSIVFVGSTFFFPDSLIRFVRAEVGSVQILRVAGARGLKELVAVGETPQLCIVEERFAEEGGSELDLVLEASAGAMVALAYYRPEIAKRLMARSRRGATRQVGYVPLQAHMDIWLAALRIQLCGERFVPSELLGMLDAVLPPECARDRSVASTLPPAHAPETALTARELQVLELVSDGKQNKSIANELGLSEHTVKLHVHNVLTKLKVRNRTGATTWYMRHGGQDRPAISDGTDG